jgi:hypothetical protein
MKILAKTATGFMVEATEQEICNMSGFYNTYSNDAFKVEVGREFGVSDIFKNAREVLDGFVNIQKDFEGAKDKVSKLLGLMAPINPKKAKA